jgi:hypothetical protein
MQSHPNAHLRFIIESKGILIHYYTLQADRKAERFILALRSD